jgi:short-subunit dehydrogenase
MPAPPAPVILVTGASAGIGAATAWLFARGGWRVALAARRLERLEALADEIAQAGGEALPVVSDCSLLEDVQSMVSRTLEHFGQVDVLFNNAGFGRLDWLEQLDPQRDIAAQLELNLLGLIYAAQAVLPHMIARRQGHIINMASMAGLVATPTYSVYAASKFGVRGFSEALRREVGVYGVKVSILLPGGVATEFSQHARIRRKTRATTPAALRLAPDQVAQAAWRLVQRPRRMVILPWPMVFTYWLNLLAPGLVDRLIERRFVRREREV